MTNTVIIVQDRPTQFDVPFYAQVYRDASFNLVVFYTQSSQVNNSTMDIETSIAPQWDHLHGLEYPARFSNSVVSIWRQIVSLAPDCVVICGWYPRSHALIALLLRMSGICIGVRSDNTLEHTNLAGLFGRLKRAVMSLWLCLYQTWHPVGSLASSYLQKLSLQQKPVFFFPYAVDVNWFEEKSNLARCNCSRLRRELGLRENDYVVLGVMKWSIREDPLTLIDALLKAAVNVPSIKLLLVGDGPLKQEVADRFFQYPELLVAPGYAEYSKLPSYYGIADVFVHPAKSEPYGVSVQEAMACGLPVIVSDKVGAAVDFIEVGCNGDIFPVGDVDRLKDLLVLYASRAIRLSNREPALRKAEEWSYSRTLAEFQRCLNIKR